MSRATFTNLKSLKSKLTLAILTSMTLAAMAASAHAWLQEDDHKKPLENPPPVQRPIPAAAQAQQEQPSERVEAEVLVLRPHGFEPDEIKRPAGRFILAVRNRSELPELSLRLARLAGEKVREVRMRQGKVRLSEVVELPPGRYTLTEEQTGAVCRITLAPR